MKNRMGKRVVSLAMAMLICLTAVVNVIAIDNDTSRTSRNFANVVIFAYFQDETNKEYYNESSKVDPSMTAAENILEFYDGAYGRSFKNYMSTISDGQFIIQNVFPQWDDASKTVDILELPFKKSDAESGNIDYSIVKYVAENSSLPEDAVVDYDNDGLIDNLTIILQGGTTYDYASTMPSLYPHQS